MPLSMEILLKVTWLAYIPDREDVRNVDFVRLIPIGVGIMKTGRRKGKP